MYEIDKTKFGAFVAQLRKEKGLMQKELAQQLFVSDKAVSKWERGLSIPDVSLLVPLSEILGVTVTELLECRRLPRDESMDSLQTDEVVKKVIGFTEGGQRKYRPDRVKRGLKLLLCAAIGCLEIWILTLLGYSMEELSVNLLVIMGLMAGFGAYFCIFSSDKLPQYYDSNRISAFSDGILRMNVPGVYFNNRNWPYIVRVGQLWAMIGLVAAPAMFYIMNQLFQAVWDTLGILFILIFSLGGLFLPMYYVGRKYEFGREQPQSLEQKDLKWIGSTVLITVALVLVLRNTGFSTGSGFKVMWSERKNADSWSASYAYHDGVQQRSINAGGLPTTIEAEIVTTSGTIGIIVTETNGDVIFEQYEIPSSTFSIPISGKAQVRIVSDGHKGSFSLNW